MSVPTVANRSDPTPDDGDPEARKLTDLLLDAFVYAPIGLTLDGQDLNPLLQDPGLAFHPPFLYLGYVGFSLTFSFAVAALLEGRVDAAWARWVRPWTLAAWLFLTVSDCGDGFENSVASHAPDHRARAGCGGDRRSVER